MFLIYLNDKNVEELIKWTDDRQYIYCWDNGVNVKMNKMPEKSIERQTRILKTLNENKEIFNFDDEIMYYFHKFICFNLSDENDFLSSETIEKMKYFIYEFLEQKDNEKK